MHFADEPRPQREDIPESVDPADILFEVREFSWEWRRWRAEINGDLVFLYRFRSALNDSIRLLAIVLPIVAIVAVVWVGLHQP